MSSLGRTKPRVLFVGRMYAGHRTRFVNLQAHARASTLIDPSFREVTGWVEGGWIERLPLVPRAARGRLRATVQAAALAEVPRPDVIWTSVSEVALPHCWAQYGPLRRPFVLDLDWTFEQQEQLASVYFGRPPKH